jgi:hypothetical protein
MRSAPVLSEVYPPPCLLERTAQHPLFARLAGEDRRGGVDRLHRWESGLYRFCIGGV